MIVSFRKARLRIKVMRAACSVIGFAIFLGLLARAIEDEACGGS